MALVRTTVATEAQARTLADALIQGGLAACVHTSRIHSTYIWKGRLEDGEEWLVEARTVAARVADVQARMRHGHPYELPLVEAVASSVGPDYAAWAEASQASQTSQAAQTAQASQGS